MPALKPNLQISSSDHAFPVKASRPKDNAYTSSPWWYDLRGLGILKLSYRSSLSSQVAFFEEYLGRRHLEVAIGTGTLFKMILKRHRQRGGELREVTGTDYSPEMLEGANQKFGRLPEFNSLHADIACLPLPSHSFDSVNVANAVHCFADVHGALAEIRRVLVPGGSLALNALLHPEGNRISRHIAATINSWGMRKGILHASFSQSEILLALEKAGFRTRRLFREGNCLFVSARS